MLLAVLQGVSELFPISSLGHTVLIPALLRWPVTESDESFLAFVVVLHLGTALALIVFYWKAWVGIVRGLVRSVVRGRFSDDRDERIAWLLVAGTIPVCVLGVLFQSSVRALFGSPLAVSLFLLVNACIMFAGEALRNRVASRRASEPWRPQAPDSAPPAESVRLEDLDWRRGALVGVAQGCALLPGISRSGSAIVAGLLAGLDHEDAATYSFLLATPVILAASVLEIPKLFAPELRGIALEALAGGVLAGLTAYASVAFLTRYFRHNDLRPFGWYCLVLGGVSAVLFALKVIP
jgi:undecaprenyl-diphosphatase